MTDQVKFFYMASIKATLDGRPVVCFNTISAFNNINVTASMLNSIQQAAAEMATAEGVEFTDLVVENLFCLTPIGCTEKEFVAGTQLVDQLQGDPIQAQNQVDAAVEAAQNSIQAAVNEAVAEDHATN